MLPRLLQYPIYAEICLGKRNLATHFAELENAVKAGLDKVNAAFGKK